ncbi:MAG: hypothetical protein ATN36_02740 [Epulopiscium sp. Nele67-Bin005]|nr:MAG: hypothetical protein ATN36_02740 [Epulopiscium sp. Nele67-Bin005]
MLNIAICDDETSITNTIASFIYKYNPNYSVSIFNDGDQFLEFLQSNLVDLIFLDIEIGNINGIEIGNFIRKILDNHTTKIVFITAKDGYEISLFDIQPLNFIKKPIQEDKIIKCLTLTAKLLDLENEIFEYKKGYELVRIPFRNILYFESLGKKVRIITHTTEDEFYYSLKNIKQHLPTYFVTPHASFVVNFNKITHCTSEKLTLTNNHQIPISQRSLKSVREMLLQTEKAKR